MLRRITQHFDGKVFAKNLIVLKISRFLEDFFKWIGEERLRSIIEQKRDLQDLLPEEELSRIVGILVFGSPLTPAEVRDLCRQYAWAEEALSDEDFLRAWPKWAALVVQEAGEDGLAWRAAQISWLRGLFSSRPKGEAAQR